MKSRLLVIVVLSSIVMINAIISSKGSAVKEGLDFEKQLGKILIDNPVKKVKALKHGVYKEVKKAKKIGDKLGTLLWELFVTPIVGLVLNPLMGIGLAGIAIYCTISILPYLLSFLLQPIIGLPLFFTAPATTI